MKITPDRIDIQTLDGRLFSFPNSELGNYEARQFVDGFIRACECFGIWHDGQRLIGAGAFDVKAISKQMRDQLPPEK